MTIQNPPNILFLCVDQWPGKLLGCAGHQEIETPTIDRLASNGTHFTRAYSETPICIPARRSIKSLTSTSKIIRVNKLLTPTEIPFEPSNPT